MPTPNFMWPDLSGSATPDVPYEVGRLARAIDATMKEVEADAGEEGARAEASAKAYADSIKWARSPIAEGDLNSYKEAATRGVSNTAVLNLPVPAQGNLTVVPLSWNFVLQRYVTYQNPPREYVRYFTGTTWGAWTAQSLLLPTVSGNDLDTNNLRAFGFHPVTSTTIANAPAPGKPFGLIVFPLGAFIGQLAMTYETPSRLMFRRLVNDSATPWEPIATATDLAKTLKEAKAYADAKAESVAAGTVPGAARKAQEYEDIVRRGKGGVIGTGGKAAIAFRFDHGLDDFKAKVWPLFEARGLPASMHVVSDSIGNLQSVYQPTAATWADLKTLNRAGVDMWAHSRTHSDPSATGTTWEEEIITPRDAITANGMRCMGWSTPGSPATYGGSLDTPDKIDTVPGQMIRANYGLYEMYMLGSTYRTLPTNGCRGLRSTAQLDNMTAAEIIAIIDEAVKYGYGVSFMMHPVVLDQPGRITTAALTEVLDYVAALRANDKALVLTSSGLAFADAGTSRRFDLNPGGAYAPVISHPVRKSGLDGHTFELVAKVRSTAGGTAKFTVTSTMEQPVKLLERTIPVAAGTEWREVRVPFLAGGVSHNTMDMAFGSASGTVEWKDIHAYPI